ncbi:CHAT domain-containing protein [Rhizobium leguminosarum bv. viciae]|uniref:CHAT domain-containing protein n=1 Tax=Rhizobium ruizarguesonis TaxID=2081791 RepID=UPI00143F6990|nr:CHAT domain-containing protein [Rhizobium ruizarguesonis]NKJ71818.1 CHAT domain-containing protein [Rhizobium leguminosarum bv. viciae]NKQ77773.1 hypothetical protein [Rhizobium ruizarguesonis]
METIDAGDVPLETIIGELLGPEGLRRMIGDRAIACFALVRPAVTPAFFEKLIQNAEMVDATMRQHVAFIVFHGKESSILRRHPNRPAYYKYHVDGLSMSQGDIDLSEHQGDLHFRDDLTDAVRIGANKKTNSTVARVTEVAVSHLATRFAIAESTMPCLLFVDGTDLAHPVVVSLAREETIKSLYDDALAAISDEFRRLEQYWALRQNVGWHIRGQRQANETIVTFDSQNSRLLARAEALVQELENLDDPGNADVAKNRGLVEEKTAIEAFCSKFQAARNLDERVSVLSATSDGPALLMLQQQLREAEDAKKAAYQPDLTDKNRQAYQVIARSVNRLRGELGTAARKPYDTASARLHILESELRQLDRSKTDIQGEIRRATDGLDWLIEAKKRAEATIAQGADFDLGTKMIAVEESEKALVSRGYSPAYLDRDSPNAIAVVRLLLERGEIGASRHGQSKARKNAMLKILFLAANPSNADRLDLEEEQRAIERELRAVKFRDNISLVAKHAVRADDLLFYLREEKPDVVHFSGHGSPDGIIVREDGNGERPVANKALARLLKDRGVKLVVLNSCYSQAQAEEIDRSVPAVVGTTDALDDEAGRKFSAAFYRTLGNGHSLAEAFRDGGDAVQLHDLSDVFQIRGDASTIYLS